MSCIYQQTSKGVSAVNTFRIIRFVLFLLIGAALLAACLSNEPPAPPTATPVPTVTPAPTASATPASVVAQPPEDDSSLRRTLSAIGRRVSLLRGLSPTSDIVPIFMERSELQSFLITKFEEEDREDIFKAQQLMSMLNLIPPGLDLFETLIATYEEQVLGIYDYDTESLYVVGSDAEFGVIEETTYAHEFQHALQQQHFSLSSLTEAVEGDSEASAALSALFEGDAYVTGGAYISAHISLFEIMELIALGEDTPVFDSLPEAVQKSFLFPPVWGTAFVQALVEVGGFSAIDQAFENPPTTTEQIMHPEKYLAQERALPVTLQDLTSVLGDGWTEIDRDVMGEFGLLVYLEEALSEIDAAEAVAGWGGDAYVLLEGLAGERILVILSAWDTEKDAQEFFAVALAPLEGRQDQRYAGIQGNQVLMIIAPTVELQDTILAQFPGFQAP